MNLISFGKQNRELDISWSAIIKVALAVFVVYGLFVVKDILLLVLLSLVISILFGPAIDYLQKFRISRTIAVAFVYTLVIGLFGLFIYSIAPIFKVEISQFIRHFPFYFEKLSPFLTGLGFDVFSNMDSFLAAFQGWLINASSSILGSLVHIFGGFVIIITVFIMAFFFSIEEGQIENFIKLLFPKDKENSVIKIWKRTQVQISGWFGTRLIGAFVQGVLISVTCLALGIKYPVLFGVVAFVCGIIPFVGSLTSGTILTLFVLLDTWQKALLVAIVCIIVSQIKNSFIIPILSKKFINLPVPLILVSLLVGERLWGPLGAIMAIPMFGMVFDFTRDFLEKNKD